MVGNTQSIAKRIVLSSEYQSLLNELRESLVIPVEADYEDMLAEFDDESLSVSRLDENEIFKALNEEVSQIQVYSEKKFRALDGAPDEQEFAPGEQVEIDDSKEVEEGVYSQGFLLINIIEYLLAKADVDRLQAYLKLQRIPNAKKYAKQVFEFVNG
jgi:hypothetical protein